MLEVLYEDNHLIAVNKKSGDIVYLDNRPLITRNARQKEDVKIILEF